MDPAAIGKKIKTLYPQYSQVDDAALGQKYMQKYGVAIQGIQSGNLDIKDIPEKQRIAVSFGLPENAGQKIKPTPELDSTNNLINILEENFQKLGGGEYEGLGARYSGVKKSIQGKLGLNDAAKIYEDQKKGFAATLKQLTGDTGVLTDQDYQRLAGLIPSLGATKGEAQAKFNDLRSQVAAKFGGQASPSKYQAPESKGNIFEALLPGSAAKGKEITQQQQEFMKNPSLRGFLKTSYEASPLSVVTNPKSRETAGEAATLLSLLEGGKAVTSGVKSLLPGNALKSRAAIAEASKATASGDNIYKTAEKIVSKTASETDRPIATKLLKQAEELKGKNFTMQEILDKLTQYNKAYTTSGRAGKSAKALVNDALSKAARQEIKSVAPDVAQAQEALKRSLGLSKFGNRIAGGVAGGAATALLYKLLFGNKQQQ